ncbi:MAG: S41 family peptidase [Robiginitomaculum sp.]
MLSACGGGGGGGGGGGVVAPPPGGTTGPTWTAGQFKPQADFANKCAAPRAGTADTAGSTKEENFWLRSWSDETYLWYNEITDQNPASFTNRLTYFKTLKTAATTASGAAKDKFHFSRNTADYDLAVASGASAGYGARFRLISASVPRQIFVAYTETGSPAEQSSAALLRGTEILEIDGVDAINGGTSADVATLNAGLFPKAAGEAHTFKVRDHGTTTTRTITMTSAIVTSAPVRETKTITTPAVGGGTSKTGYVLFNTFGTSQAEQALFDAFTSFAGDDLDDLVIDLRYNGGGFLDIASELGYMVAGSAATNSRTFEEIKFNSKHPTTNPVTGATLSPTPFHSQTRGFTVASGTALPQLDLNRVFILSTGSTCSASEALINSLRGINVEVVLIGGTTCGKPYGFYATGNCGETYFTIQFVGVNDKDFGDYTDGFTPMTGGPSAGEQITGCFTSDDFSEPLGDENEGMFATALTYIQTDACPPAIGQKPQTQLSAARLDVEDSTSLYSERRIWLRRFLEQNRVVRDDASSSR